MPPERGPAEVNDPVSCGVIPDTSSESCPECRDVPEDDINSTLTQWRCFCDNGTCKAKHRELCEHRRTHKAIVRLIATLSKLAMVAARANMQIVVRDYKDVEDDSGQYEASVKRIFYYEPCSRPREPLFSPDMPEELQDQAASIGACIFSVVVLSPALAWLSQGLDLRLLEADVKPRPVMKILLSYDNVLDCYAGTHTVLIIAPNNHIEEDSPGSSGVDSKLDQIWEQDGRVADATFRQYDYDRDCHKTSDYYREKINQSKQPVSGVVPFGSNYHDYWVALQGADSDDIIQAERWRGIMQRMNEAVYKEVKRVGGNLALLQGCSHKDFLETLGRLIETATLLTQEFRAEFEEEIIFPASLSAESETDQKRYSDSGSEEEDGHEEESESEAEYGPGHAWDHPQDAREGIAERLTYFVGSYSSAAHSEVMEAFEAKREV